MPQNSFGYHLNQFAIDAHQYIHAQVQNYSDLQKSADKLFQAWSTLTVKQQSDISELKSENGYTLESCLLSVFIRTDVVCTDEQRNNMIQRLAKLPKTLATTENMQKQIRSLLTIHENALYGMLIPTAQQSALFRQQREAEEGVGMGNVEDDDNSSSRSTLIVDEIFDGSVIRSPR